MNISTGIDNSDLLPELLPDDRVTLDENGTPDWAAELILAQIRVVTATKEGTLEAAKRVVDHYAAMGVNGLWVSPIYEPGNGGNGYTNLGPHTVDPRITGTMDYAEGLERVADFVRYAHSKKVRVLLDIISWGTLKGSPILNGFLISNGIIFEPKQWLTDSTYMMGSALVVMLWMSFGAGFLSFIAGFKNVDSKLYEAGAIDGIRNRYQEMWYITLPSMKPQLMFSAVMSITSAFGTGDVISAIYGFPSTNYSLYTLVHALQDYGNVRFEMGYASAIATVLFLIMMGSNLIVQRLLADKA